MSKLSLGVAKSAGVSRPAPNGPLDSVAQLARWDPTSLMILPGLAFEDWEGIGRVLGQIETAHQWWMGDWWNYGERQYGEMASQAITLGIEPDTLSNMAAVAERVEMPRRRGNVSWSHHQAVAYLGPEEQVGWLDRVEADGLTVNDLRAAIRRSRVLTVGPVALPSGKYAILLADPPWQYDFVEADNRAIENQYPTLTADEIACYEDADGRPVADLPADDAVLYLWATNPKLTEAMRVVEGWGFQYVTNMVWVKDRVGMGYWARQRHELLLIARRGDMSPPPEALRPDSVIEAPRAAHSVKPESVHELIEAIWPDTPKVELFARSGRSGWAVFGNQVP